MIFLPISQLKPGMELAEEIVVYFHAPLVLLHKGALLTDRYLRRMYAFDVGGAYIEDGVNTDIVAPPQVVDKELRAEAVYRVKSLYCSILNAPGQTGETVQELSKVVRRLTDALSVNENSLVNIADLKSYDDCTYRHSLSVAVICIAMGLELGFDKQTLNQLGLAAILHDIGKMNVPIDLLNKPGKLNDQEFNLIRKHAGWGGEYLEEHQVGVQRIVDGVRHHHEQVCGKGYPARLTGDDIPLFSRMISVADVYDALTAKRPYRDPMQPAEAAEYLMANCDMMFDARIVRCFLSCVQLYPTGSCVLLSDKRRAVVVDSHHSMRPVVRLLDPPYTELDLFEDQSLYNTVIEFSCQSMAELENLEILQGVHLKKEKKQPV